MGGSVRAFVYQCSRGQCVAACRRVLSAERGTLQLVQGSTPTAMH